MSTLEEVKTKVIEIDILCQGEFKLLIKCNWRTCKNYKDGVCRADSIELKSFDYEEDNEELEGLKCATYEYDSFWMCDKGREVDVR